MSETITVEFLKPKNHPFPIVSNIIQLIEGTNFSHVAVRINAGVNREFVYHSNFNGTNFMAKSLYNKKYKAVARYKFEINKEQRRKLITWFLDNAGKSYPVAELFGVLIVRIVDRLLGKHIGNPLGSNRMYCSETAVKILKLLEFRLPRTDSKVTALIEIKELLEKNYKKTIFSK